MNSNRTMSWEKAFMTKMLGAETIVGNMIVDCITIFLMSLYKNIS